MLDDYRDVARDQRSAVDRVRPHSLRTLYRNLVQFLCNAIRSQENSDIDEPSGLNSFQTNSYEQVHK